MEFFFALFFLLFYYLRPQDWVTGLIGVELIRPIIAIWLVALIAVRSRPSPLSGLIRTPHDWAILAYCGYIVFFGDGPFLSVLPFMAFYFLTVQSVTSWGRLLTYLKYWNCALVAVASLAVLSTVGFDLTGAQDNHFTQMGRLALGTWLHNNPNALCHSVVVAISGTFLLYFWRGSIFSRLFVFPALAGIVFYCAWLTQSKGGYVAGAGVLVMALIIGRPRWIQVTILSAAMIGGVSALSFLPRMNEMGDLQSDEGVQGRIIAWQMAQTVEKSNPTGIGWNQFIALIPWKERNQTVIVPKATHSSYVQVGADLGRYGLFFYLAGIWCCLHTLLILRAEDTTQERCRRVLMIFVLANILSGWMINREYHTEYFLLIAAAAAMHRLKKGDELAANAEANAALPPATESASGGREANQALISTRDMVDLRVPPPRTSSNSAEPPLRAYRKPLWNRFGILDIACCIGLTWLTFWTWDYLMKNV